MPDPAPFGGVVVTGSPHSVRDEAPWMAELGAWILATVAAGTPVLAVCFGHQVLGEALGGRVELNPSGAEIGTITVELTEAGRADALFAGLGTRIQVQATHRDALVRPPTDPRVVRLAGNANTPWQAFSVGPLLRAVQFHPELAAESLRALLVNRGQQATVQTCPAGARMLENWDRAWVRGRPPLSEEARG